MSTPDTREALYLFCDPENWRYELSAPWVRSGVTYATDGRICVAIDTPGLPNTIDDKRRPNVACVFTEPQEWHPLPDTLDEGASRGGPCWHCLGYGKVPWNAMICQAKPCEHCEPDEIEWEDEHEQEFVKPIYSCMLLGVEVSRHFIEKLRILLNGAKCEVGVVGPLQLVFRWNGGKAALMGLIK